MAARKSAATVQTPGKAKAPRAPRAPAAPTDETETNAPPPGPSVAEAAREQFVEGDIDPTTLTQAVMSRDGWVCPEKK